MEFEALRNESSLNFIVRVGKKPFKIGFAWLAVFNASSYWWLNKSVSYQHKS
jgi:hypothetical protein